MSERIFEHIWAHFAYARSCKQTEVSKKCAYVLEKWQAYLQLSRLLISTLRNAVLIIMISFNFDSIWFSASFLPSLTHSHTRALSFSLSYISLLYALCVFLLLGKHLCFFYCDLKWARNSKSIQFIVCIFFFMCFFFIPFHFIPFGRLCGFRM